LGVQAGRHEAHRHPDTAGAAKHHIRRDGLPMARELEIKRYDAEHGYHHRHYFGPVRATELTGFEATQDQFQAAKAVLGKAP